MDEEEKDDIKDILNKMNRDVELPPYNNDSGSGYSREYLEYKEEEEKAQEKSRFERFCIKSSSILNIKAGESTQEKLSPPLRLLGWDVTPGMVMSGAITAFAISFFAWLLLFGANMALGSPVPVSLILLFLSVPITAGFYTYMKPVYAAQNKVIKSSGEMILSILYMVVYMRSSPNLEGAIRFAALNLEGPIADDLKGVLWDVEVGKYKRVSESLEKYTTRWKDYNDDFLESLNLLKAAMEQPGDERREKMLQDAIDNILEGTQEKMKHYAQNLQTPVMIINAIGALLPVLGMIMLPLISAFMGGVITPLHLIVIFNILLPGFLWWFMQRTLSSRPPTVATQAVDESTLPPRGRYPLEISGNTYNIPTWPVGAAIFLIIALPGILGYIAFPKVYPIQGFDAATSTAPSIFVSGGSPDSFLMLMRSVLIVLGLGLGIGISKILGNVKRKEEEEHLQKIESQFPSALFELGNKISGGTPIELGLEQAAESTSELEISDLFSYASRNIQEMGMTFEEAIFDENYGALKFFPSRMIRTVMKAILESSEKGTHMASTAMMTVSRYLENLHQTQEKLNDLMEDTTTTIQMLAYLLAPIISGVAVGMSQTIITALYTLSTQFTQAQQNLPGDASTGANRLGGTGFLGNLQEVIPPEMLQFTVGFYLIMLLYILGTFYMKITKGEDKTYKNLFIGKVLISGMIFYTMTLMIISLLFGGIVGGISSGF